MLDPVGTKLAVLGCHVPNAVLATLAWPAASTGSCSPGPASLPQRSGLTWSDPGVALKWPQVTPWLLSLPLAVWNMLGPAKPWGVGGGAGLRTWSAGAIMVLPAGACKRPVPPATGEAPCNGGAMSRWPVRVSKSANQQCPPIRALTHCGATLP